MSPLEGRIFSNLVDDFCEGFWLDRLPGQTEVPAIEVDLRHVAVQAEGMPEDVIRRARKAAAVMVTSGSWKPEDV